MLCSVEFIQHSVCERTRGAVQSMSKIKMYPPTNSRDALKQSHSNKYIHSPLLYHKSIKKGREICACVCIHYSTRTGREQKPQIWVRVTEMMWSLEYIRVYCMGAYTRSVVT